MAGILLKRNVQDSRRDELMDEMRVVRQQLQNVSARFEQTCDSDLVEATIYEIQSLRARYRYLVKTVREIGVEM